MRTIEQAEKECRAAWIKNPSTWGWCVHHDIEIEELIEPIEKRIVYILENKPKDEIIVRLDNLRPVLFLSVETITQAQKACDEAIAPEWKAQDEAIARAWKAQDEAIARARKARDEAIAPAHRQDVPNHAWNGKSIFED